MRRLLAAIVLAVAVGTMLSLVYVTDAALSIIERLERLPTWLNVAIVVLISSVFIGAIALVWRLLRPSGVRANPRPKVIDRSSVQTRLADVAALSEAQSLQAELHESDRRAVSGELYIALFGEVSAGKSSLARALVGDATIAVDIRAGTTREVRHYSGVDGAGLKLTLADVPGTGEWLGEQRAVAAREEALRSHAVLYVCDSDLTRSQREEFQWLREFGKPMLLVLNKSDRYRDDERLALRQSLLAQTGLKAIVVSAASSERVRLRHADGREALEMRERPAEISPLRQALHALARQGIGAFEPQRERAVLGAVELKLSALEATQRRAKAEALVREYARKAALMAMAAIAPGSDLVIQGILATRLLSELTALYGVSLRSIDLDNFVDLAGGRLRGTSALVLAIAGNALKAFPGLGTVSGGLVHAVAYAMIFDSLGRAVTDTLEQGHGFSSSAALANFSSAIDDRSRLLKMAPAMLQLALDSSSHRSETSASEKS